MIANMSSTQASAKPQADTTPASSLDAFYKSSLRVLRHLLRNPMTLAGLLVAVLLIVVATFAPWIATHDPVVQNLANALQAPGAAHWFGTDEYGRDIFSRLVYGSRITLYIITLVTVIVGPIGLFIGTVSGYYGGIVDTVFMRITDIFISFPSLVLALAFIAALGPGLEHAVVAIALTSWPPIARLARAETLSLRKADFVVAVELQGASSTRIICVTLCRCACRRDHPPDHEHGRDHPHRRGAGLPRPWRTGAAAGVGRDDLHRSTLHARMLVAGGGTGCGDHAGEPGVQPAGRWPAGHSRPA